MQFFTRSVVFDYSKKHQYYQGFTKKCIRIINNGDLWWSIVVDGDWRLLMMIGIS